MSAILGLDASGNGNNWTVNNLSITDQMLDSPTNNFATWNPLASINSTFAEGNLQTTTPSGEGNSVSSMAVDSGKWYVEFLLTENVTTGSAVGVVQESTYKYDKNLYEGDNRGLGYYSGNGNIYDKTDGVSGGVSYGSSWTVGDIIGIAYDADNSAVTFYKNGNTQGTHNLDSSIGAAYIGCGEGQGSDTATFVANFGQDSSFAGNKAAQGNTDSGGIGDFFYEPPTGFLALCTKNLPEPTVVPSEHFDIELYTGDNTTSREFSNFSFQPDLMHIRMRNGGSNWGWFDSVRGVTSILKSNTNGSEVTSPTDKDLLSFDDDGFTVGQSNQIDVNTDGVLEAAWAWKAGGNANTFNIDGTGYSTVSAAGLDGGDINPTGASVNTKAGFSIISYTNTGSDTATVEHGLSKQLDMVIVKSRGSRSWHIGHVDDPISGTASSNNHHGYLSFDTNVNSNTNGGRADINSATTFIGEGGNGVNYIAYCFHSVDGYSKVGSYTGNGSSDGTFVHTGFKPAYVMVKRTDSAGYWALSDSERSPFNVMDDALYANASNSESTPAQAIDYLSNGFKFRSTDSDSNSNSGTHIYIAFAEHPFKYSTAK